MSICAVRYPITSGVVPVISHIFIQGVIQSVADGARLKDVQENPLCA